MSWCLTILVLLAAIFVTRWHFISVSQRPPVRGDVLFVFAHPDDEAMFFAPILDYLKRQGVTCHFLCLSNGNFAGLGTTRETELLASATCFGIPKRNVKIVDHPDLQDGMSENWPAGRISREIAQYLEKSMHISTVITFDRNGVSSHPNHIAVHEGAKKLKNSMPPGIIFLQLRTRHLMFKYTGCLSLVFPLIFPSGAHRKRFSVVIPPSSVQSSFVALQQHASQLVWFRYLFVAFSSYTYLNELSEITQAEET